MNIFVILFFSFIFGFAFFNMFGRFAQRRLVLPLPYIWAPCLSFFTLFYMLILPHTHLNQKYNIDEILFCWLSRSCNRLSSLPATELNFWDFVYMGLSIGAFLGSLWIIPREQSYPDRTFKLCTEISLTENAKYAALSLILFLLAYSSGYILAAAFNAPQS